MLRASGALDGALPSGVRRNVASLRSGVRCPRQRRYNCGAQREIGVQLTRETTPANVIRAWEPGRIRVLERWIEGDVIVSADRLIEGWVAPTLLAVTDLREAIVLSPEIILLGTGPELTLPDTDLMAELAEQRIGLEVMSTPAACRTYNVLVHEQRRVVAVLLNPAPSAAR
jgi:uncharacterized protein